MVAVGVTVSGADDLKGIEDISDQTIRFGNQVFRRVNASGYASRADQRTDEEPVIKLILMGDSVVDVNHRFVLNEDRRQIVVFEPAQLELIGQSGFDITNGLLFALCLAHIA